MDIIKINALDNQYVQNVENQIIQNWNVKILSTASTAHPTYSQESEIWKKRKIKYTRKISFVEVRKIEQTQEK